MMTVSAMRLRIMEWSPCALSRYLQQQVAAGEAKEQIGRPRGEERGQHVHVAHRFECAGYHPIRDGDADGGGDAGERAALAHKERERHRQYGHDERDERIGDLVIELHAQPHGVKAALPQVVDVTRELDEAHLRRLAVLFFEIGRRLGQSSECAEGEFVEAADGLALKVPVPSVFEYPLIQVAVPVRRIREDAAGQGEVLRVEFEYGDVGESIVVGIEELVVVDTAGLSRLLLAEDPLLVRAQKGLRGLALDDTEQRLLAAVRAGKIAFIEDEEARG